MDHSPLVTVIIPTYNRAQLIARALRSVLDQSYRNFEVLVIDDCSADDTVGVVRSMNDPRIRYERNSVNAGVAFSRNRGIGLARGEYISLLDSDDYYLPGFLEKSVAKLQTVARDVGFIWTGLRVVGDNGIEMYRGVWKPLLGKEGYQQFLRSLRIGTGCGLTFRAEALREIRFNARLRAAEDTEFFLRFVKAYAFDYVDEILIVVSKHEGERVTRDMRNTLLTYLEIFRIHREAICRTLALRLKYFDKIMTLAYRSGRPLLARRFFRKSLPDALFRPRMIVKFIFFETGRR